MKSYTIYPISPVPTSYAAILQGKHTSPKHCLPLTLTLPLIRELKIGTLVVPALGDIHQQFWSGQLPVHFWFIKTVEFRLDYGEFSFCVIYFDT